MHHSVALLLVAILATVALAAPTAKQTATQSLSKRSFTVPRVRKAGYIRKPSEAMGRAYRKFGWSMTTPDGTPWVAVSKTPTTKTFNADASSSPSNVTSDFSDDQFTQTTHAAARIKTFLSASFSWGTSAPAASSASAAAATPAAEPEDDETGEVIATPADNGAEYLSPVTIGGQQLNLNFDTGSADLWVFSTALTSDEIGEHSAYDPSKSSTYQELRGYTFSLSYGDGSGAAGTVGCDTVDIGGATVTRQVIELATSVSSAFVSDADSDGLVGLAFSTINSVSPDSQKTFFDNIMSELAQPVFTAALDLDGSGTYEFGTIDSSKFTGDLMFTNVNASSGFWQIDSNSYSIGGRTYQRSSATPAIVDTGTSLLLLDPEVVRAYYAQVSSAKYDSTVGGYTYDCSEDLPEFAVAVGDNYMANIPGSGITFAPVSSETCFGGIQSNSGSDLQIFGDVLLKHHFVVFHGESELLGMAAKAE
ncbi:acid protease [Aureobasidium subglaciale]|nr:acid protease [Aureobasidium subglaciale]